VTTTVDTNVLLYASDPASRFHARALAVVEGLATGPDLVRLLPPVVVGYIRIATHPRIFVSPLPYAVAVANVEALLDRPNVALAVEGDRFWKSFRQAADPVAPRGNIVSDAHLVAVMREHGIQTMLSGDRDLRRFDGIRVIDPFA
jgi:uncharacterized protein